MHRDLPDPGPPPGAALQSDADYANWVAHILDTAPPDAMPLRLFAYGSLIWKPELDHVAAQPGTAHGWHRAFCQRLPRFRGTPEVPGLMMALDRGGQCRGMLFTLPAADLPAQLDKLFRREFTAKPANTTPRWLRVRTASGPVAALGFVMNRASPNYTGRLPEAETAAILARACGSWGTGAEYLMNTVRHLEALGLRDARLWRLQALVAARIEALTGPVTDP